MLCGHSLEGALATICSLDLRLSLNLKQSDILVNTFGSPRLGNFVWERFYEQHVHINWRFSTEVDVVTMMLKSTYKHVGKRVLITDEGNLFMDPSSLQGVSWMGDIPSVAAHKKSAYQEAIEKFCKKYLLEFRPVFCFSPKNVELLHLTPT